MVLAWAVVLPLAGVAASVLLGRRLAPGIGLAAALATLAVAMGVTLKGRQFVVAARALGVHPGRVLVRHVLPNCLAPIMVQITLATAVAILIEAGLSYLGCGGWTPTPTWGNLLKQAQSLPAQAPWYVLALDLLGDALRDRLDPRLRRP